MYVARVAYLQIDNPKLIENAVCKNAKNRINVTGFQFKWIST